MVQPVETTTILNAQPFWILLEMNTLGQTVQAWERWRTDGKMEGRCQTYYLPCFAVDKHMN